jgi:hypothetical protein
MAWSARRLAALLILAAAMQAGMAAAAAAAAAPAQATAPAAGGAPDPAAYVLGLYDTSRQTAEHGDDAVVYTPRLAALFIDAEGDVGELGRLEMDYVTGAQDRDVKTATVTSREVEGAPGRRVVSASFNNLGQPRIIHYLFERQGDGRWYLDDVHNQGGQGPDDRAWTLSLILKYGFYGS